MTQQWAEIKYACGCTYMLIPPYRVPDGCPEHWGSNLSGVHRKPTEADLLEEGKEVDIVSGKAVETTA